MLKPHDSAGSRPVRERFGDLSGVEGSWRLEAVGRWLQIRDGPFFFFSFLGTSISGGVGTNQYPVFWSC